MQDIIFYVAPYGTRGIVRDRRNAHNVIPPTLTRGVAARLRLRLFADRYSAEPYPLDSIASVSAWSWIMDDDWDRGTMCKLSADATSISVRTISEIEDETALEFTEFILPIYEMDSTALGLWIGRDPIKAGLQGELIGLDASGDPVFVLQINNFSVRNRLVSGDHDSAGGTVESVSDDERTAIISEAVSSASAAITSVSSAGTAGSLTASAASSLVSAARSGLVTSQTMEESIESAVNSAGYLTKSGLQTYLTTTSGGYVTMNYLEGNLGELVSEAVSSVINEAGGTGGISEVMVSRAIADVLGDFATRYGLTPVPIVKYAAPTITPSRSNSVTSNTNVTLSATGWDAAITSKEYSSNNSTWSSYTGAIIVSSNGWRYFRGMDSDGDLTSTASYQVTNIDKTGPTINLTGYNISAYTPQVISASTTEGGVQIYWSPNNATWSAYTSPVSATSSGTWYFSASDQYGNKTTKSLYFPNIGGSSGGSGGWDDDDQPEI